MVELKGIEPLTLCLQGKCSPNWATTPCGGRGGIWTHGCVTIASFQDWCNKPDSATLPNLKMVSTFRIELKTYALEERCSILLSYVDIMVAEIGFEPMTFWLWARWANQLLYSAIYGRDDRTWTCDFVNPNHALYQLSHIPINWCWRWDLNPYVILTADFKSATSADSVTPAWKVRR